MEKGYYTEVYDMLVEEYELSQSTIKMEKGYYKLSPPTT